MRSSRCRSAATRCRRAPGLQAIRFAPDNPVRIGEPTTINATLEAGGVEETVEVRASAQVVQTETSGNLGSTFDQRTIESLPILGGRGRNPLDLVLTQPGVVSGANTGGGIHVHGARDRAWNFTLDGIDINESSAGGSNFSPLRTNPDALAEFKVLTGNSPPNSAGTAADRSRWSRVSGSNRFSGTLFYFDRRPEYNANEWENNIDDLKKRVFTQKMPGFSVGGPIRRNKTFFFVNTQWLQRRANTRVDPNGLHGCGAPGHLALCRSADATCRTVLPERRSTRSETWRRRERRHVQHPGAEIRRGSGSIRRFSASSA